MRHLDDDAIATFPTELGAMGNRFQFSTLAGWHAPNESAFALASAYPESGMTTYTALQEDEFAMEDAGCTAT